MNLSHNFNYIDGITIINTEGTILFTVKFDPNHNKEIEESVIGKNLFHVFPNINKDNSSLIKCMEIEDYIFSENQLVKDLYSKSSITNNISYPIINQGRVIGAIELSQLVKTLDDDKAIDKKKSKKSKLSTLKESIDISLGDRAIYQLEDIICKDESMLALKEYAAKVAIYPSSVLIIGETGTGKELFAHGIHNRSDRKDKPFVAQNCSAVPENLLESIFFGTSEGGFTDARNKQGLFEAADGGTLFLDELHAMPLHLQAKLLRAIETGTVRRIGENKVRKFDTRIIAATNKSRDEIIDNEYIREDLFYRISVINIDIPPLRDRKKDIQVLSNVFIKKYNELFGKNIERISEELIYRMNIYDWPGNVRELENFIESAILASDWKEEELSLHSVGNFFEKQEIRSEFKCINTILDDMEFKLVEEALLLNKGNVKKSAEYLNIPRQTLQQKMKKFNLDREEYI